MAPTDGSNPSKDDLLRYIRGQEDSAASFRRILDDFEADAVGRRQIREILDQLVKDGALVRHKGRRYEAVRIPAAWTGRIALHPDGYGFVTPDAGAIPGVAGDVFIPPPAVGSALDGDRVAIALIARDRAEGRVVRVVERARTTIVGQLRYDGRAYFVSPADEKLPDKILVGGDVSEHKDKVVEVQLTRFGSESRWPAGRIVSTIGFLDDPEVETTIIIKKYGLSTDFPESVEREAAGRSPRLAPSDVQGRADFRDREIVTIDPATARDFDDAVDVEALPDGGFRLGVHVADVAHFVAPGSAADREARERGCSVYFPDRVVPMLPEKLSNDICSLNPRTDRLAMSVVLEISSDGRVRDERFRESVIRSRERFSYAEVQGILDGDAGLRRRRHALVGTIESLARAARVLGCRRLERGAIDFDLPEPELDYDEDGLVVGIVKAPRFFSHRMIEEFMIAANEAVARLLEAEMPAAIFRIHEPPDPDRIAQLADLLAAMGLRFPTPARAPSVFQRFLQSVEGRADARMIAFLVLRSFRQASYSSRNRGHFGLASGCYTHFTSPIRRYPDLVVHRLLKARLSGLRRSGYIPAELEAVAASSSARERIAQEAERDLFDWKRMNLLEEHLGDALDAVITRVLGRGIGVELVDYFIEGQIAVEDMEDDYYELDARSRSLVGRGTRRRYRLGQRLRVRVARIDKLIGRAYFLPVSE